MAAYAGFAEKEFDNVFICLDKMDKIGLSGVKDELLSAGYQADSVEKYLSLFETENERGEGTLEGLSEISTILGDYLPREIEIGLNEIADAVLLAKEADFKLVFDPTLVRGMSYYTGTIFEVSIPEFGGSCGGGGRYDEMVGRFTGKSVPACGFSIGFERIVLLLLESGFSIPEKKTKMAFLIDKKYPKEKLPNVFKEAADERKKGNTVLVARMNKNKKFQKENLRNNGYESFREFFGD